MNWSFAQPGKDLLGVTSFFVGSSTLQQKVHMLVLEDSILSMASLPTNVLSYIQLFIADRPGRTLSQSHFLELRIFRLKIENDG